VPATVPHQRTISTLTLPTPPKRPLTLLVFTANGAEPRARLRLDTEFKAIKNAAGSRCHLVMSPMASFADVVRDLDAHRPMLVHFSGHTDHASGHLILQSELDENEIFVSPRQLANILAELRPAPVLVTFTARGSTALAEAAAGHARFAIGFEGEYPDEWAPLFSATLYERLTSHPQLDVPRALKMTTLAWMSEGQDVAGQARLYARPSPESSDALVFSGDSSTSPLDVLIVTALRDELDALLSVSEGLREPWTRVDDDPPRRLATFDGAHGPVRVAAVRLTEMAGIATATVTAPLLDALAPRGLAMCGVCAGHPGDTDRGDVVIAERVFQYDLGELKNGEFQGDLWVSTMTDPWLRAAQDFAGPAEGMHGYSPATKAQGRWWFLGQLRDGRDPLRAGALRRYIPDEHRSGILEGLTNEGLVKLRGGAFTLTKAGREAVANQLAFHGQLVEQAPYHVHVGPMGSGNAVATDGEIWGRLTRGGMRRTLAVEMEAATIGQLARKRRLPFAVAKGVMDHADADKSDRFKAFAARAAAEVLCGLLRRVEVPR
nr:hypothetical protein [Deltaproteobacteria bacterium]